MKEIEVPSFTEQESWASSDVEVDESGLEVEQVNDGDIPGTGDVEAVDPDVDMPAADAETVSPESDVVAEKPAKKGPKRGELPEGYVTPVGLAKLLTAHYKENDPDKLNKAGDFPSQQVYSYIRNAPADSPFPLETVTDGNGTERSVVKIDAGLQWFLDKDTRTSARKQNAAEKAAAKAAKSAEKPAAGATEGSVVETPTAEVVEAE
jgi:hypothetical protein